MLVLHDYITPRLNGIVFLDKPILYYWLQASAMKLFGINEWALRLWPALFGLIGCLATYLAGRIIFNRRTAILSTIILATSPLYFGASHYANLDLEVAVLISCTLLCFITATQLTHFTQQRLCYLASFLFAGLAVLTKGLIGLAFPAMIIGSWIVLLWQWRLLKSIPFVSGTLLFMAVVLPWYLLAQQANPEFFHFFFVTQQFTRFLSAADFNNKTSFWFYFPIVIAGFLPWSAFIIQALSQHVMSTFKNRKTHQVELFILLWLGLIFTFFSIPRSKTIGYILPIFPALALLVGHYLNLYWDHAKQNSMRYGMALVMTITFCAAILLLIFPRLHLLEIPSQFQFYLSAFSITFSLATVILYLTAQRSVTLLPTLLCIALVNVVFLLTLVSSASTLNENTIKPLALELKSILQPNDEIITYYKYYQDLPLYLEKRIAITADWAANDIANNDNWVRELWYGMNFRSSLDSSKWLINEDIFWQRWSQKKRVYVLLNKNYFDDFQRKAQRHRYYQISQWRNTLLLSNRPAKTL
ncbi:MAG: hypothetical protein A3E84_02225 [Gammaproteobacteria bacterium RIFCSPHIGHO2_12_FULL_42_13]|nr:MAG: hypothetical protein A3E84_02225 [Gammaproteobacteria bacterium RIFCSPHIGHO2_12_FULL_42_13]